MHFNDLIKRKEINNAYRIQHYFISRRKVLKKKKFRSYVEQTYLSRHERLGNNSARDNNVTKISVKEKESHISTVVTH